MKGIYVINSLEGGGAERVFSALVSMISDDPNGDEIEVILLDKKTEVYSLPKNVLVHRIGQNNPLMSFYNFFRLIKKIKPKYVVSFLTRANIYNAFTSLLIDYKSVISERSNTSNRLIGRFKNIKKHLVAFLYNKADCVIAVSKGVEDCLADDFRINRNKIKLLNNPVNIDIITSKATTKEDVHNSPFIVAMGRLVKTKGFESLIRAYANAKPVNDLLILGEGPELNHLIQLTKALEVHDKVHFIGFQSNPYPFIKQSQFFVLPSELEGFPNALMEALGLGKAVLSTNCTDGPSEILCLEKPIHSNEVVTAKYGLLVNIQDEIALAKGLLMLEQDMKLKERYEQQSLQCAEQFSPEKIYNNFKGILKHHVQN